MEKMTTVRIFLGMSLATGLAVSMARADDGFVVAMGGSASLVKGHPTIRMASESVTIKVPERKVRAEFVFVNHGPATDVTIGFPESGGGVDVSRSSHFTYFRSTVDGKPIKCTLMPNKDIHDDYSYWWVKKVHFEAKQTRRIVSEYGGTVSSTSNGWNGLPYTLRTGASWKGKIGYAKIVADIGSLNQVTFIAEPKGYRMQGTKLIWEFRNFEPDKKSKTAWVSIDWYVAFRSVSLNGKDLSEHISPLYMPEYSGYCPKLVKGDFSAPIEAIATWIGATVTGTGNVRTLTWTAPNGKVFHVTAQDGSKQLLATTKDRTMLYPASIRSNRGEEGTDRLVVRVGPVIRALGGEAYYDAKSFTYRIKLKGAVPRWKQEEEKRWKK